MRKTAPYWLVAAICAFILPADAAENVAIPLVGCPSDGQLGPQPAPKNSQKYLPLNPAVANRLAFYTGESDSDAHGILGPRGWHCFRTYGSSGQNLYIAKSKITSEQLFSNNWKGITGPAIQWSLSDGETSGRFEAALIISKAFPKGEAFVQSVKSEGLDPNGDYKMGPYPGDHLKRRGDNIVEYETPPGIKGLGWRSFLVPDREPIRGVVILKEDNSVAHLATRLPREDADLADTIIRLAERR